METEKQFLVKVKDEPDNMVFKFEENELAIPTSDSKQNQLATSPKFQIKAEEAPAAAFLVEALEINSTDNSSFVVPYKVDLKDIGKLCDDYKYEIKQEPGLDLGEVINKDLDNIKTEIVSGQTNNYCDTLSEQEIKNEELVLKDEEDIDEDLDDKKGNKSATQLFKATKNASQCTNPSSQLTRNEAYLQQHIIKHEKVTTDQTNFNRQLLIDKNKKSYVCGICEITFNKKANVDSHFVSHHSDNKALMAEVTSKIHKCQHCSYKCISHSNFKRHNMVIHKEIAGNVKTFKCEYCQYCTHRKYLLVRHTLIHGKVKPQVCSACCKSFIHKGDLDSHIVNNHSDNIQLMGTITYKIHECQQCSYKCVYSQSLKRHMVKHKDTKTNLQKFECEHCEYSTYIKNSLKRHLLIHSSNKPHICVICSKSFTSKHQIDSHILHKHFDNTELKTTITQKIHECPKCSYKCIIKNQLNHHLLKHNKAQI